MSRLLLATLASALAVSSAEVFFSDKFDDGEGWKSRWVVSDNKVAEGTAGKWDVTPGKLFVDAEADKGLTTTQDARFYSISSALPTPFSSEGKTLVLQFSVKHEQGIDCGGGYIKILPAGLDQSKFNGDSAYNIMFGPDICGSSTRRIHAIFNHAGTNKLIKKDVACETDKVTHVYTLVVNGADRTYEILVDNERKQSGSLAEHWDFLAPKEINDPAVSKPADWVDAAMIDDPEAVKPADWDNEPKKIADPEAVKPDDWDDEADGVWEAPMVPNPAYKGEWKPKKVPNPAYKGVWEHPKIDNPDFKDDLFIGQYGSNAFVGFELWQVKAGTVFDNILVTDDVEHAKAEAAEILKRKAAEQALVDAKEKEEREAAEAKAKADVAASLESDSAAAEKKDEDKDEL